MAQLTTSTFDPVALKVALAKGVAAYQRNNELVEIFGETKGLRATIGGANVFMGADKKVHFSVQADGTDTSEAYVEGDSAPAGGVMAYATASINLGSYQETVRYTGHARRYGVQALTGYDMVSEEISNAVGRLTTKATGLEQAIFEAAIDSAGTYGGLTRSTYNLASHEVDWGTTLVECLPDKIDAALAELHTGDRRSMTGDVCLFTSPTTHQAIRAGAVGAGYSTTGAGTMINSMRRLNIAPGGDVSALAGPTPTWNGKPIIEVSGMTSGTLIAGPLSGAGFLTTADFELDPNQAHSGDEENLLVVLHRTLVVVNPHHWMKMTF